MRSAIPLSLLLCSGAIAQSLTIDFNDLAPGSTLANQYLGTHGVNFIPNAFSGPNTNNTAEPWATNTGLTVSDYVALDPARPGYAVGSPMLFDGNLVRTISDYNNEDGDASLLTTFVSPVTSATVTFVGIAFFPEGAFDTQLLALDADNNVLAQAHALEAPTTSQQNLTVSVAGGFKRLAIVPGNYNDIVGFDNLVYTPAMPSWDVDGDGIYWNSANWSTGQVPAGSTASARFGEIITQPRTVTLNDAVILNKLVFDSAVSYTLRAPSLAPSFAVLFGGTENELNVAQGSHQIEARVTNASSATIANMKKTGAGSIAIQKLMINGNVAVEEGTLVLRGGDAIASKLGSVSVADGAQLAQGSTPLIVTAMTEGTVRQLLLAGKIAIGSPSTLKLGYRSFSQGTTVGGETVEPIDVVIRATLPGDASLDLQVNFDDLLVLAMTYGRTNTTWYLADFDYDGDTDFDDLLDLAHNYGGSILTDSQLGSLDQAFVSDFRLAMSLVPEPSTMLGVALFLPARRRRA